MSDQKVNPPAERTPFQRLADLTRRVVAVPKEDIDKAAQKYERAKRARQRKRR